MKQVKRAEEMHCPLAKKKISEIICTDAILVAEDIHPERFAPEEIRAVENWKEICQRCVNNPYSED